MRHGNKINHLGRKTAHRKALLMNLSKALIEHKRINTTLAKAKELRKHIEPLLNKAKTDSTHNRRILFSYLQDKEMIKELFSVIADKIATRPGGYTRIIKLGFRKGDAAEMAMIELVDFNEVYTGKPGEATGKKKARRGRGGSTKSEKTEEVIVSNTEELVEDVTIIEEPSVDVIENATSEESIQVVEDVAPIKEEVAVIEEDQAPEAIEKPSDANDLKVVEGIGPKIEEILNAKGIFTYAQLADTSADVVKGYLTDAGSRFASHDPGTWAEQAALLRDGKMEEFKALTDALDGGKRVD